jgi:hypothetical protein
MADALAMCGGCPGWEVPLAGVMVMSEPWRGLPRGSPPGGAESVTVTVTGAPAQSRAMASVRAVGNRRP